MEDCRRELAGLLLEEVSQDTATVAKQEELTRYREQRLAGASLLVFANKQDIRGSLTSEEIAEVSRETLRTARRPADISTFGVAGAAARPAYVPHVPHPAVLSKVRRRRGSEDPRRPGLGRQGGRTARVLWERRRHAARRDAGRGGRARVSRAWTRSSA